MLCSLIKMLYSMCQKSQRLPTWRQLEHAIKRNFGGLETEKLNPFKEFERLITIDREQDLSNVPVEVMKHMAGYLINYLNHLVALHRQP